MKRGSAPSSSADSKRAQGRQVRRDPAASEAPAQPPPVPIKPRRMLFVVLLLVFAVWVGFLVWMYFATPAARPLVPVDAEPATLDLQFESQ